MEQRYYNKNKKSLLKAYKGNHKTDTKVKTDLEDGMALFDEILTMQGTLYRDNKKHFQPKMVIPSILRILLK